MSKKTVIFDCQLLKEDKHWELLAKLIRNETHYIIGERTGISPLGLALKGCILFPSDFVCSNFLDFSELHGKYCKFLV
jgi:hypothetical protein